VIVTCPKCFSADDVTYVKAPDAGFLYTCTNAKRHPSGEAYEWVADAKDPTVIYGSSEDGVTTELMDPLEQIIRKLPPAWIEYGVRSTSYDCSTRSCSAATSAKQATGFWPRASRPRRVHGSPSLSPGSGATAGSAYDGRRHRSLELQQPRLVLGFGAC
jgi:hypothetical protein